MADKLSGYGCKFTYLVSPTMEQHFEGRWEIRSSCLILFDDNEADRSDKDRIIPLSLLTGNGITASIGSEAPSADRP